MFETVENSVFVFTLDPHIASVFVFPLHVGSHTIGLFSQTEHLFGQTEPLSLKNRASVCTKHGLCVCLKSLLVFFTRLCLNPGLGAGIKALLSLHCPP